MWMKFHLYDNINITMEKSFPSLICPSALSDERSEKRERESILGLLCGLLHVCSCDRALLTRQSAGPAEKRGRQVRLDVQIITRA